jgi:VWFA-related protein
MKRNLSTQFVLMFGLIVMFLLLAGSGCKGHISQPPAAQTPADQPPADQPPADQPPADPPPADPPPADPPVTQPTAAQINVSSRQIASGAVVLNNISDQTVSIKNTGSASLNVGQIAQANPLASPFSIVSDNCSGRAVQSAATCSFHVQFSPISQGTFTDSFDIPSDAANENVVTVDVAGSGKALREVINQVKTDGCATGILELIVAINDLNNAPLSGLTPGNFQLTENGVPQVIYSVTQILTPVPISVAMVLDYTASMQSQIPTVEAASKSFVDLMNAGDEAAIIKFATSQQLMQDFTGDAALLKTAITATPSSIGSQNETRLYDALWFAVETTAPRQQAKAIVLISDGKDVSYLGVPNVSVKTPDEVIAYAKANAEAIYTVGLGDVDAAVMNRLASETGGQFFPITGADQLAAVYQSIRNILSGQYSIQYVSSLHGSVPITLNIDVAAGVDEGAFAGQFAGCP